MMLLSFDYNPFFFFFFPPSIFKCIFKDHLASAPYVGCSRINVYRFFFFHQRGVYIRFDYEKILPCLLRVCHSFTMFMPSCL